MHPGVRIRFHWVGDCDQKARVCQHGAEYCEAGREVEHLHHSLRRNHDVGRFQIAMDDVLFVGCLESVGDLARVVQCRLKRKRPLERSALDELHHQRSVFDAVNLSDVGMIERGQHFGFALEAGQSFGVFSEGVGLDFDRYFAIKLGVAGAIHLTHAARAERREDFVGAKMSPSGKGHGYCNNSTPQASSDPE